MFYIAYFLNLTGLYMAQPLPPAKQYSRCMKHNSSKSNPCHLILTSRFFSEVLGTDVVVPIAPILVL